MESRRQKVSGNRLTSFQRIARSKPSTNAREYSEAIPIDLIFEILLRLPARSIAKCRCVSKPWASMLRRTDFTELYLSRSRSRPQLLFACFYEFDDEVLFFSSPQPQKLDGNVVASFHRKFRFNRLVDVFSPIRGVVSFRDKRYLKGRTTPELVTVICNLSTGEFVTLPRMKTRRKVGLESFLGYDPVGKQFKVLSMTSNINGRHGVESEEHQVLTLATREPLWRMIDCDIPHFPKRSDILCNKRDVICINGVVYYVAAPEMLSGDPFIVCFDVRTETYSYVEVLENSVSVAPYDQGATLINYYGKLASLRWEDSNYMSGKSKALRCAFWKTPANMNGPSMFTSCLLCGVLQLERPNWTLLESLLQMKF